MIFLCDFLVCFLCVANHLNVIFTQLLETKTVRSYYSKNRYIKRRDIIQKFLQTRYIKSRTDFNRKWYQRFDFCVSLPLVIYINNFKIRTRNLCLTTFFSSDTFEELFSSKWIRKSCDDPGLSLPIIDIQQVIYLQKYYLWKGKISPSQVSIEFIINLLIRIKLFVLYNIYLKVSIKKVSMRQMIQFIVQ